MPCCIATLHYLGCQHHKLYKLRCTTFRCDSQSICPRELQCVLVEAKYRWSCEECVRRGYKREDDERFNTWAAKMAKLANDESLDTETWTLLKQNFEEKIDFAEVRLHKVRKSQVLEIQRAEKWVRDYASTTLELLYGEEDFEDGFSNDSYDDGSSMSGPEEEQPQVSDLGDVPMQDAEPEQNEQDQEPHDSEMEDEQEISSEPGHNRDTVAKLARLEDLLLVQACDLIIVRDASRAADRQLDGKLQQGDAAPEAESSSSAAASKPAPMPADQTQTLARGRSDSRAVSYLNGVFWSGM